MFLLKIFCELKKICQNAVLLLVGDGHLADILKNECKKLGIDNDVIFTWIGDGELKGKLTSSNITITGWKNRKEVLRILNEQDIFILTSLWEGLPLAVIEAQVSGLKCIVSSNVTTDTKCTENIIYKDLTDSAFEWAKEILTFYDNNIDRHNVLDSIRKHGFDITYEAMRLRKIYLS